jgi:hypothetical protein
MPRYRRARIVSGMFRKTVPAWAEKSESPATDQQIDNEYDQYNTANPNAAAISPPGISKTASEDEEQYENNQENVHRFLR